MSGDARDAKPAGGGLPSWSIRRPIGTVMLTATLLILGLVFVGRLPVDLLPEIEYPQVRVNVSYPGVEPVVLEEIVAKPLEAALAVTDGMTRLETEISEGWVSIGLHFEHGTDIDFALQDAAKNVERVRSRLPEDADPPTLSKSDPTQMPIYQVAFSSDARDRVSLREWVDQRLRPQLLSVPGVAAVEVSGGLVREIQVVVDQERLRGHGLTVSQVIGALRAENQDIAAGRITSEQREIVSKTVGKFRSVDDIRAVLLTGPSGARVPITEVAQVRDTSADQRSWARLNGSPAVRISVRKQPGSNTVEVVDGVAGRIAALGESHFIPKDIKWSVTYDQSGFIRDALGSVKDAAVGGALLAMMVVLLFLKSFRKTFIIGVSIPLAIVATFIAMGMGHLTLNVMSLGGLALGTGILLDNAIVMLENIYRRREQDGLGPVEGAHVGAAEVQSAVVASTTTNIAAVAPFLLMTGLSALIFRELILTISFAILASLPLALTLVPMLAAQLGKVRFSSGLERARPLVAFERGMERLGAGYRRAATGAVRHRWKVLGAAVGSCVLAILALGTLESTFLPQVDDGSVGVGIRFPTGTSPHQTNRAVQELEALVSEMPGVQSTFATAFGGRGSLDVRLAPVKERGMSADEWVSRMQAKADERGFAGARVFVRPPRIRGLRTSQQGVDLAIQVQGDDLAELERIGGDVEARLKGVPGLENVEMQQDEGSPQLQIVLDRERLRALGLDAAAVGQTVRTAVDGTVATRYAEGNLEYDVRVMLPRDRFTSADALAGVALFPGARGGPPVYLRDVATVRETVGPTEIERENQNRVIELTGDVITEVAPISAVTDSVRARLAELRIPDGYGLIIGGEEEAIRETNQQMLLVIALAIFLVFVVMAVQYESLVDPLVILLAIPLGLVGVIATLWATNTPLSAPVFLGMILLAGIVVNNAILLVEFVEGFRHERGVPKEEAVVEAGCVRMRPILMTTLTSMIGSAPLALGLGEGSELMRPLAIAVVGGIAFSTLLTLFVVPCAYVVLHGAGERVRAFLVGGRRERELAASPSGD
ncbi:MAG TPA: efflux RND transporter permease subunit [Gemmatimonadaceae bacterium]|nr:efflux RND transporter permease subunit [Gemmatimonadaceae bacterium]